MSDVTDCLFCKIANKEIEAQVVREDEKCVAFRDVNPQAPVHILIIPKIHVASLAQWPEEEGELLAHLFMMAKKLGDVEGLSKNGYRVALNIGAHGGQTVNHLHVHLMGGRAFRWPPG